jgi:hypothetical protein
VTLSTSYAKQSVDTAGMTPSAQKLLAAALLLAAANAQSTVINDPSDTDVTTVTFSTCPTALTTTTTLSSTMTVSCPNGQCNGAVITAPPKGAQTSEILAYTTTLPDGSVEEIHEYLTIYPHVVSSGSSIGLATYYLTMTCPCEATRNPADVPAGFTTTVIACHLCHEGGPTTLTQTMPCSTGPYASVTPIIGPTGAPGAYANAEAAATAAASAMAMAGPAAASAAASAYAAANAHAEAGVNGGAMATAGASSNAVAEANSGGSGAAANANANANANAQAGAGLNSGSQYNNGTMNNSPISPPITPVSPGSASGANSASQSTYTGSAYRVGYTVSSALAVVVGCLAFLL